MTNLLDVDSLTVSYRRGRSLIHAVNGVSFSMGAGEVVGIVGESGCGKSTLAKAITGLVEPSFGAVRFQGNDIKTLSHADRGAYRRGVQMVFQDPLESLNPRRSVLATIRMPLNVHRVVPRLEVVAEASRLLASVGLAPAATFLHRYPHQMSGGQRQRVGIARALAPRPSLIVCDEPVSNLDVTIQAQIISLLAKIRKETGVGLVIISHDLGIIRALADRVLVMYLGRFVEDGPVQDVLHQPRHPYTSALLEASPRIRKSGPLTRKALGVFGEPPSLSNPPPGCHYAPRCPLAQPVCNESPPLVTIKENHLVRCHFAQEAVTKFGGAEAQPFAVPGQEYH